MSALQDFAEDPRGGLRFFLGVLIRGSDPRLVRHNRNPCQTNYFLKSLKNA